MSEALRGGGEVSLPTEKGWVAPAHTGDPPPREVCASDNGGPRPTKVKVRSDAVVASKQVYCACARRIEEESFCADSGCHFKVNTGQVVFI